MHPGPQRIHATTQGMLIHAITNHHFGEEGKGEGAASPGATKRYVTACATSPKCKAAMPTARPSTPLIAGVKAEAALAQASVVVNRVTVYRLSHTPDESPDQQAGLHTPLHGTLHVAGHALQAFAEAARDFVCSAPCFLTFLKATYMIQITPLLKASFTSLIVAFLLALATAGSAQGHSDKEAKADAQRHRARAVAHETAAQCLESGKDHEQCRKALQTACKGRAIGKYCGMKHAH